MSSHVRVPTSSTAARVTIDLDSRRALPSSSSAYSSSSTLRLPPLLPVALSSSSRTLLNTDEPMPIFVSPPVRLRASSSGSISSTPDSPNLINYTVFEVKCQPPQLPLPPSQRGILSNRCTGGSECRDGGCKCTCSEKKKMMMQEKTRMQLRWKDGDSLFDAARFLTQSPTSPNLYNPTKPERMMKRREWREEENRTEEEGKMEENEKEIERNIRIANDNSAKLSVDSSKRVIAVLRRLDSKTPPPTAFSSSASSTTSAAAFIASSGVLISPAIEQMKMHGNQSRDMTSVGSSTTISGTIASTTSIRSESKSIGINGASTSSSTTAVHPLSALRNAVSTSSSSSFAVSSSSSSTSTQHINRHARSLPQYPAVSLDLASLPKRLDATTLRRRQREQQQQQLLKQQRRPTHQLPMQKAKVQTARKKAAPRSNGSLAPAAPPKSLQVRVPFYPPLNTRAAKTNLHQPSPPPPAASVSTVPSVGPAVSVPPITTPHIFTVAELKDTEPTTPATENVGTLSQETPRTAAAGAASIGQPIAPPPPTLASPSSQLASLPPHIRAYISQMASSASNATPQYECGLCHYPLTTAFLANHARAHFIKAHSQIQGTFLPPSMPIQVQSIVAPAAVPLLQPISNFIPAFPSNLPVASSSIPSPRRLSLPHLSNNSPGSRLQLPLRVSDAEMSILSISNVERSESGELICRVCDCYLRSDPIGHIHGDQHRKNLKESVIALKQVVGGGGGIKRTRSDFESTSVPKQHRQQEDLHDQPHRPSRVGVSSNVPSRNSYRPPGPLTGRSLTLPADLMHYFDFDAATYRYRCIDCRFSLTSDQIGQMRYHKQRHEQQAEEQAKKRMRLAHTGAA